jgi:hypothetical protein
MRSRPNREAPTVETRAKRMNEVNCMVAFFCAFEGDAWFDPPYCEKEMHSGSFSTLGWIDGPNTVTSFACQ